MMNHKLTAHKTTYSDLSKKVKLNLLRTLKFICEHMRNNKVNKTYRYMLACIINESIAVNKLFVNACRISN
jgi:hypothetical protein